METKMLNTAERLTTLVMFVEVVVMGVENWALSRRVRRLRASLGLK